MPEQRVRFIPRVWAMPEQPLALVARCRFIPTRVGNAKCDASHASENPVHPHACGECDNR